jgi:hypothetical protein
MQPTPAEAQRAPILPPMASPQPAWKAENELPVPPTEGANKDGEN